MHALVVVKEGRRKDKKEKFVSQKAWEWEKEGGAGMNEWMDGKGKIKAKCKLDSCRPGLQSILPFFVILAAGWMKNLL